MKTIISKVKENRGSWQIGCGVAFFIFMIILIGLVVFLFVNRGKIFDALSEPEEDPIVYEDHENLVITEGMNIFEIAEKVEELGVCTADEFLSECETGEFEYDFINNIDMSREGRQNRLEGYLFPDTYFVAQSETAWDIINKMLDNFNTRVADGLKGDISASGMTLDEIVIRASIIEKEVRYHPEAAVVASVINNRIEKGMKLQMDATVLYAKQENAGRVMESDTQIESPYNTYYIEGLPAGPVSNPGLNSIKGVLEPADTDYIYYVVDDQETGQHYFTADYDDFLAAKERYLSGS